MSRFVNIHDKLSPPTDGDSVLIQGSYEYYNYNCDGFEDAVRFNSINLIII